MVSSRSLCGIILIILVTALILFVAFMAYWGSLRPPIGLLYPF